MIPSSSCIPLNQIAGESKARRAAVGLCAVEGCEEPRRAKGMCRSHYQVLLQNPKFRENDRMSGRIGRLRAAGFLPSVAVRLAAAGYDIVDWVPVQDVAL